MPISLSEILIRCPVIPLIEADDPATGVATARALQAGGISVVEVVQRTDASLEALKEIACEVPGLLVGAGTVLNAQQADACLAAGARFVVSPGLDPALVEFVQERGVDALPGVMTPTEAQRALSLGLELVKFFPAATAGGVNAVRALASVFRGLCFVPTGGISADNLAKYLALDNVAGCGGSWMTPPDAIAGRDFDRVTALAAEAITIAAAAGKSPAQS